MENLQTYKIEKRHAALSVGSGSLDVLSTPSLVAFMEQTAFKIQLDIAPNETTVGIEMNVRHIKASKIGEIVSCRAVLSEKKGKIYTFSIQARNEKDELIGDAIHKRAVVNVDKFLSKIKS